jgi:hypothetical protein
MSSKGVPSRQSSPTTDRRLASTLSSFATDSAMGFGRTGDRKAKVPRARPRWRGTWSDQIAPRPVHKIEHHDVREGLDAREAGGVAVIDFDGADRSLGFARVLWALLAGAPGCVNGANEIKHIVESLRQLNGALAGASGEFIGCSRVDGSWRQQLIRLRPRGGKRSAGSSASGAYFRQPFGPVTGR